MHIDLCVAVTRTATRHPPAPHRARVAMSHSCSGFFSSLHHLSGRYCGVEHETLWPPSPLTQCVRPARSGVAPSITRAEKDTHTFVRAACWPDPSMTKCIVTNSLSIAHCLRPFGLLRTHSSVGRFIIITLWQLVSSVGYSLSLIPFFKTWVLLGRLLVSSRDRS